MKNLSGIEGEGKRNPKTGVETPVSTNLGEKTSLAPSHSF
jgi:hypothetical protein